MKIAKPAGEVGCPGHGGYKLKRLVQWNTTQMRAFKVFWSFHLRYSH